MKYPLIILFSLFLTCFHAQGDIVANFRLAASSGQVLLSWDLVAGNTCDGISILRSADGVNFQEIELIEGICGSITEPIPYSFLDETPVAGFNHYKIQPGLFNASEILAIEMVIIDADNFEIRPNPIVDLGKIYFNKQFNDPYTMELFDLNGKLIQTTVSNENFFIVHREELKSGLFIFRIFQPERKEQITTGKLVIGKN